MGSIYSEFEKELELVKHRTQGQPAKEIIELLLKALEREEIVSVGYRESLMTSRLNSSKLSREVSEMIQHALIWIWKDEEMHAIYVRGALMKFGSPGLKATTIFHQLGGAVGGWATSVLHHRRWRDAPVSLAVAQAISKLGSVIGKVPTEVRPYLHYGSFRDFCLFNVEAERTAWLCWKRLCQLLSDFDSGVDWRNKQNTLAEFARIADDEERHRRLFKIFADNLNEKDELVEGKTVSSLTEEIARVGSSFLPRRLRRLSDLESPVGSGGTVVVLRDDDNLGGQALLRNAVDKAGLKELVGEIGKRKGKTAGELKVAIKTSFMLGYHEKDRSPVVDPALVQALASYLAELGVRRINVLESPNLYDLFFNGRSVQEVGRYFGFQSDLYSLVDTGEEQVDYSFERGLSQYSISKTWQDADLRISFGKLRSHPIWSVHLTLGNLDALGTRCDQFIFIERQARMAAATAMIVDAFPPQFAILDAYENIPDGVVGVMGCKHPKSPRRIYAGADALSLDIVAARHVGVKNVSQSNLLEAACHWFGGPTKPQVFGCDEPIKGWRGPFTDELSTGLSLLAHPVYEFGSARGALFVPEMDEQAFPPFKRPGMVQTFLRRQIRRLIGLDGLVS